VAIVVVIAVIYAIDPGPGSILDRAYPRPFFTTYSLETLAQNTALYGILAVGVAVVIIAGGIDLSIGSLVALSAVVSAKLMLHWLPGMSAATPFATGLLCGMAVTLLLWMLLPWAPGRLERPLTYSAVAAAFLAAFVPVFGDAVTLGTILSASFAFLFLLGVVFGFRRWADERAAAVLSALLWGLAGGLAIGKFAPSESGFALPGFAFGTTALAVIVGQAMGLKRGTILLAGLVAATTLWGLFAGPIEDPQALPLGLVVAAVVCALLLGLAIGVGHAFLINVFRLPAFIATLASLAGLRSLATILSDNRSITINDESFRQISEIRIELPFTELRLTVPILIFAAVAIALSVMMGATVLGRHFYALGGNENAARLSGLPTRRLKTIAYAISGLLAALGGILFVGYTGQANPRMGMAYELFAITAAVVGGCSLAGGAGSIRGTVLGMILIQVVIKGTGLVVEGIDPSQIEGLVLGIVVILAIGFNQRFRAER